LDELQFYTGEKYKDLKKELLLKSSESNVPYRVSHEDYLTNTILVLYSFLELLFDWYSKKKKENPSQPMKSTSNQYGKKKNLYY